jgi:hypothetical protein
MLSSSDPQSSSTEGAKRKATVRGLLRSFPTHGHRLYRPQIDRRRRIRGKRDAPLKLGEFLPYRLHLAHRYGFTGGRGAGWRPTRHKAIKLQRLTVGWELLALTVLGRNLHEVSRRQCLAQSLATRSSKARPSRSPARFRMRLAASKIRYAANNPSNKGKAACCRAFHLFCTCIVLHTI